MPIPPGDDAFHWTQVQANRLQTAASTLKIFFAFWGSLTGAQKTALRNNAVAVLDSVTAELVDIRAGINSL